MTYHLAALRLRSIGERSARFTDVTLDFTAPHGAVHAPADSVVWLRNGGGKSSLLSLFYALVLPRAVDFMGRTVKRSLTDYVDSGDTAHTIAVWHPAESHTLDGAPDRVLITGVVYEWSDLRRPANADRARDRLDTTFYACYAMPGVLDLERLPILDDASAPRRRTAYLDRLREAAAAHPRAMDLVITDRQHEWTAALTGRGLDPSLFRTHKQMNHVEGGVEDLFRFSSAREFIDLLIDLTVSPDDAASVADRLASIAALLATKPAKIAERDFCIDVAAGLDRVTVAQREVEDATAALVQVTGEAADLAACFAATVEAAESEIAQLAQERGGIETRRTTAATEQAAAYDLVYLYEERAAQLRIDAAQEQLSAAETAVGDAADLIAAWEAAEHLAAKARLEDALSRTRRQAAQERELTAPLRREHDEHAARLRTRLLSLAADHRRRAAGAEHAARDARDRAEEHKRQAGAARHEGKSADKQAATASAQLESLAADLHSAARDGVLPTRDTDPAAHEAILAEQQDKLAGALAAARTRRAERPKQRTELTGRLAKLTAEQSRLDGDRTHLAAERTVLADRAAALAATGRVRDLTEATDDAPVDLWGEAEALARRLTDAILDADLALVRLEAERIDDQRTLDVHARTGLLPTTLDADRVQTLLAQRGIVAETGWEHLRKLIPEVRLTDVLTDPELARLGVGLVVPTEQGEAAVAVLTAADAATTALVDVHTAQAASAIVHSASAGPNGSAPTWMSLHRGLVDITAAETTVRQVTARAEAHNATQTSLATARESDRTLLGDLTSFLADCPAGHLDSLDRRIDGLDQTLATLETTLSEINTALTDLDNAEAADADLEQQTSDEITRIERTRTRLSELISRSQSAVQWREDLQWAETRAAELHELAEQHAAEAESAVEAAAQSDAQATTESDRAAGYRTEAAGLTFLDTQPDIAELPTISLDQLRVRHREAQRAWEIKAAQSVLAERERALTEALASHTQALATVPDQVQQHAAALLTTTDGQTPETRSGALAAARQAEKHAIGRKARAAGDIDKHGATLTKVRARRSDPPRRPLPVEPTDPQHAEALAAEHDRIGQACIEQRTKAERDLEGLDRKQTALGNRVTTFRLLADGLPDPAGRTAEPFPADDTDAQASKRTAIEKVRAGEQRASAAATARTNAVAALRTTASTFPSVTTPAKDRALHDSEEALARHAESLAAQLRLRAEMIDGELAEIADDQAIITNSLARLTSNTLDTLRKAERYSQVKTQIGGWSDRKMLRISFDAPASDADLRTYANRTIERRIANGVKPEGLPLLKEAVHDAVGPRGFTIKVLKPTLDTVATTEDITRLGKWSGAEKLTACVALYCAIAALRAANAGQKDRSGGVLLLDNPIGRSSHGSLVQLQREVAAARRVQLVYTTGVKDPDAVSRFPNVIRLDNRPGRTRNRRYIVHDPAPPPDEPAPGYVTGVRVAHQEPTDQPAAAMATERLT